MGAAWIFMEVSWSTEARIGLCLSLLLVSIPSTQRPPNRTSYYYRLILTRLLFCEVARLIS